MKNRARGKEKEKKEKELRVTKTTLTMAEMLEHRIAPQIGTSGRVWGPLPGE